MKPILFAANETAFTSNGIGRLSDAISCLVEEKRNGTYELEMEYPVDGIHYKDICEERIILAKHDDTTDKQPFRIYKITKPMDGVITVLAAHISYQLSKVVVNPCEAQNCPAAFQVMIDNSVGDNPFTIWTDITGGATFKVEEPTEFRKLLGGVKGSILDQFGPGEYEWDKWTVKYHSQRGADTDVVIRYGKNLTDITQQSDSSKIWTGIVPFWRGTENRQEILVMLPEYVIYGDTADDYPYKKVIPLDLSEKFDDPPSQADLRAAANEYLSSNLPQSIPKEIDISFVALWQTDEYQNVAPLQRLSLCDTITVLHEKLGISAAAKIISVTYNVLTERYDKMTVGEARASMFEDISKDINDSQPANLVRKTDMQKAIEHATDMINGSLGGHVVLTTNANGEPEEILIMDTDDIATAVNVLRINQNGIGFSSHGYQGPFETAWTLDGHFVADFITAGYLSATRIKGGFLSLGGADNGNGVMHVYDASGNLIGVLDNLKFQYNGTKHMVQNSYSDLIWTGNWGVGTGTDRDAPYYLETPETDSFSEPYNPTRRPNKNWYKRRIELDSGGLKLFRVQTHSSDDGELGSPIVKRLGGIQAGGCAAHFYTDSGYRLQFTANAAGVVMTLGETVPMNTRSWLINTSGNNCIFTKAGEITLYNTPVVFTNGVAGTECIEIWGAQLGLNIGMNQNASAVQFKENTGRTAMLVINEISADSIWADSQLYCYGQKNRVIRSVDFGNRLMYSYETPSPMFGDIGDGIIGDDGYAYISVDPIFAATVDLQSEYYVFLQKYGNGDCWVNETTPGYFVVCGTPGLKFAWEIKAKQFDHANARLDQKYRNENNDDPFLDRYIDYDLAAAEYIKQLEEERMRTE